MKNICTLLSLYLLCMSSGLSAQSKAEAYQEILDKAQQKGIPALAVFVRDANGNAWQGKAGFTTIESCFRNSVFTFLVEAFGVAFW